MTKSLRKKHKQVWTLLAFLLPIGIVTAWLAIPKQPVVILLQSALSTPLPIVTETKEMPSYTVNIRTSNDHTEWQVEWKNKKVLMVPTAVIYRTTDSLFSISKSELVGRIEATGDYIFPIHQSNANKSYRLILYDFIHEQKLDSLSFQNTLGGERN